jgi:EAL domain-containing protein (putative c-di-GMP-specific phosphodiesterase class I)
MARVLVIDDELLVRRSYERVLRRDGHDVVLAAHGHEGLRIASERSFDLTIVDFQMPILDGVEVLQRMREMQPACIRILATAHLELNAIVGAVNRGEVSRVIEKPIDSRGLITEVNAVLDSRRRLAEAARVQDEDQARAQRLALECLIRDDHLRLALQPIASAETSEIFAYESLMRSSLPALPHPGAVLAAAEQHGFLEAVSEVVVKRAAAWLEQMPSGPLLFINLHPDELSDAEGIERRLQRLAPWADRVVLEITERSRLQSIHRWEEAVKRITDAGFAIAVDDLGAGYSSLSVLAELQPSFVKVDMSIVRNVHADPRKRRLVDLLCRFADATGARLVAEGVETADEAEALRQCGAHLLQGYFFGRPTLTPDLALRIAS